MTVWSYKRGGLILCLTVRTFHNMESLFCIRTVVGIFAISCTSAAYMRHPYQIGSHYTGIIQKPMLPHVWQKPWMIGHPMKHPHSFYQPMFPPMMKPPMMKPHMMNPHMMKPYVMNPNMMMKPYMKHIMKPYMKPVMKPLIKPLYFPKPFLKANPFLKTMNPIYKPKILAVKRVKYVKPPKRQMRRNINRIPRRNNFRYVRPAPRPTYRLPVPVFRRNVFTGYRPPPRTQRIDIPQIRTFRPPSKARQPPVSPPMVQQSPVPPPMVQQPQVPPPMIQQPPVLPPMVQQPPVQPPMVQQPHVPPPMIQQPPVPPPMVQQPPVQPPVVRQPHIIPTRPPAPAPVTIPIRNDVSVQPVLRETVSPAERMRKWLQVAHAAEDDDDDSDSSEDDDSDSDDDDEDDDFGDIWENRLEDFDDVIENRLLNSGRNYYDRDDDDRFDEEIVANGFGRVNQAFHRSEDSDKYLENFSQRRKNRLLNVNIGRRSQPQTPQYQQSIVHVDQASNRMGGGIKRQFVTQQNLGNSRININVQSGQRISALHEPNKYSHIGTARSKYLEDLAESKGKYDLRRENSLFSSGSTKYSGHEAET